MSDSHFDRIANVYDASLPSHVAQHYLRHGDPGLAIVVGGKAVTFELAATWGVAVCAEVSTVVDVVDALVHRAPLN